MSDDRLKRIAQLIDGISAAEMHPLRLYRPSKLQEPVHRSKATERLVWGGKRAGKSVCITAEFVSRLSGRPIIAPDGTEIPLLYPVSRRDSPRQYWVIGWDQPHSATIHKLLFEQGQGGTLRCIRDAQTNEWRIWNRAREDDVARYKESQLTPPFITSDMIVGGWPDGIAWHDKKNREWKSFRLMNGAVVYYWPSSQLTAKPGEAVSGIWIDEDIQIPAHLKEWQDRLTDMEGWFLWSVWPQTKNDALIDLKDRAEATEDDENPVIEQFQLVMSENPFISDKGKFAALERMGSDEEIARRDRGDLLLDSLSMYDFVPLVHCLRHADFDRRMEAQMHSVRWLLTRILMEDGRFPRDWTRYFSIDPSHTRTAAHSWVVPPLQYEGIQIGNLVICEWELVMAKANADAFAEAARDKMATLPYEAFVMDQQIGKQTNAGRDDTVFQHYEIAFRKAGLSSRMSLSGFLPGCNEPQTRYRTVRRMLSTQGNGMPLVLFVEDKIPLTKKEFNSYRKKQESTKDGTTILDQPQNPRKHDCMASCEYGLTMIAQLFDVQGTAYVEPSAYEKQKSPILRRLEEMQKKQRDSESGTDTYVHWGPGAVA